MNFIDKIIWAEVTHNDYGLGVILSVDELTDKSLVVKVRFKGNQTRLFLFPMSFNKKTLDFVDLKLKVEFDQIYNTKKELDHKDKKRLIAEKISSLDLDKQLAFNSILKIDNNEEALKMLIEATTEILYVYYKNHIIKEEHRRIVIFTFAWLSFNNYKGNFWEIIRDNFKYLYKRVGNQQNLESLIRELISDQSKYSDVRHITNVLVHAGIPEYFLTRFYDFLYDIYEINFDYQLDEESVEENLLESIEGLSHILGDDNLGENDELKLNVTQKTYVLIKSTKLGLIHYKQSYVKVLKQMLEIIHSWYWDYSLDGEYPKVLIDKFKEWSKDNKKTISTGQRKTEYISKPRYIFNSSDKSIRIAFPQYRLRGIKPEEFENITVEYIKGNERRFLNKTDYRIIEKIGFNTIEIQPQRLDVVGSNITFNINKNNETIISAGDSLFRKFIIFDYDGKELNNFKEYSDLVYVVYPKGKIFTGSQIKVFENYSGYDVAVFHANPNIIYNCGDEIIYFSQMLSPGLYGTEAKGIVAYVDNRKTPVFNEVKNFVFESELEPQDIILMFNNVRYDLEDLNFSHTKRGPFYNYNIIVKKGLLNNNLNNISVYSKHQATKQIRVEDFLIDADLLFSPIDTDNMLEKDIIIESSFPKANMIIENYDFSKNTYFTSDFRLGNNNIKYVVDPCIKRYKWQLDDNWKLIDDLELGDNKTLYLSSIKNSIKLTNKDDIDLPHEILANDELGFSAIDMSYLAQLKYQNDYLYIYISDQQETVDPVKIYLQQVVTKHNISLNENGDFIFDFDIKNFNPNSLEMSLYQEKTLIYKVALQDKKVELDNLDVHKRYHVELLEKGNLFLGIEEKVIYKFSCYLNDAEKLEGKKFYIRDVFIYTFDKKNNIKYDYVEIQPVIIKINKRLYEKPHEYSSLDGSGNIVYGCRLYKLSYSKKIIPFNHLRFVNIELQSTRIAPILRFTIEDKDGEGLSLRNSRIQHLVDSPDEDSKYTIDYLVVNTERDEFND